MDAAISASSFYAPPKHSSSSRQPLPSPPAPSPSSPFSSPPSSSPFPNIHENRYATCSNCSDTTCTCSNAPREMSEEDDVEQFTDFALLGAGDSLTVLQHALQGDLTWHQLQELLKLHHPLAVTDRSKGPARASLESHQCSSLCVSSVTRARLLSIPHVMPLSEIDAQAAKSAVAKAKRRDAQVGKKRCPARPPKAAEEQDEIRAERTPVPRAFSVDQEDMDLEWPQRASDAAKREMMAQFFEETSAEALARVECSFCGHSALVSEAKTYAAAEFDLSLLEEAAAEARVLFNQPAIPTALPPVKGSYTSCKKCSSYIRTTGKPRFSSKTGIPLYSFANGCWVGACPPELEGLTFVELACIQQARCTQTWFKFTNYQTSQRFAKGNACIFPQDIVRMADVLPPPVASLAGEIVVILVNSSASPVSEEALMKTPLVARRAHILRALLWLKSHNPYYCNIEISEEHLLQYPEDGVVDLYREEKGSAEGVGEGKGYTADSQQADNMTADTDAEPVVAAVAMMDADNTNLTIRVKRLRALKHLKEGGSLLKVPTGNEPLHTKLSPATYACLFPTLFPYGVGLFEDPLRREKENGLRDIDMRPHVAHYLQLHDQRFQTHLSFIFILCNILQRRKSAMEARLAVRRTWFPQVQQKLSEVDEAELGVLIAKLQKNPHTKPETPGEHAAFALLRYVHYTSGSITGSSAQLTARREEIRALTRLKGLPDLFITLNPADSSNPISAFLAGSAIDLNKAFDAEGPADKESYRRSKLMAENPVASARYFDLVISKFLSVFLGVREGGENVRGLFGKAKSHYGMVEIQGRGSLHCHMLIWLEGSLHPHELRAKAEQDEEWKKQLLTWLEDIIQHEFPAGHEDCRGTHHRADPSVRGQAVMSRPVDPSAENENFDAEWAADLCDVLQETGQLHTHGETCYKHLPKLMKSVRRADEDCRFNIPLPVVLESHIDKDGHINLKVLNGFMNGFNAILVAILRCNMDLKFIGSGTAAMAMVEYVTSYITKLSMDSAVAFTALAAALKSLRAAAAADSLMDGVELDREEQSRLLLLKTCNAMISRSERSGQQVAAELVDIPNHYTPERFDTLYWTRILTHFSCTLFPRYSAPNTKSTEEVSTEKRSVPEDEAEEGEEEEEVVLDGDDLILLDERSATRDAPPAPVGAFEDYFYRPESLIALSLWEFFRQWEKEKPKKMTSGTSPRGIERVRFHPDHPQAKSYLLRKRPFKVIPVLMGTGIPRRDRPEDAERHAAAMLILFSPWTRNRDAPLGEDGEGRWTPRYLPFIADASPTTLRIISNMQVMHECRDAKDDWSGRRRARMADLGARLKQAGVLEEDEEVDDAMIDFLQHNAVLEGEDDGVEEQENNEVRSVRLAAEKARYYDGREVADEDAMRFRGCVEEVDDVDEAMDRAKAATLAIASQKEEALNALKNAKKPGSQEQGFRRSTDPDYSPFSTTLEAELARTRELLLARAERNGELWDGLHHYQRLCVYLIAKFTLNEEQKRAFLLICDQRGRQLLGEDPPQLKLLVTGPGGTGKSQMILAVKEFYREMGDEYGVKLTAPTGVAASNIGGATIHSELNLMTSMAKISKSATMQSNLVDRWTNNVLHILDEISFVSAAIFGQIAVRSKIARPDGTKLCGGDIVCMGDHAQLPPVGAKAKVYDSELLAPTKGSSAPALQRSLHAQNGADQDAAYGLFAYAQFDKCVDFTEVLRQKEPDFIALLGRVREGRATLADKVFLDRFVVGSPTLDPTLFDVRRWINGQGCPLITATNKVRDMHNVQAARAFAEATGQPFHFYHSRDTHRKHGPLKNELAHYAWKLPPKEIDNYTGRLPLIPGMPVFLIENLATEIGLSNGTEGRLVSVEYVEEDGLRFAISADVDFPSYTNSDPSALHPHRVTLEPHRARKAGVVEFGAASRLTFNRHQLPLVPAFAYTAHNSQGRSLDSACLDLSSSRSIESSYVMLSRVRSTKGLAILRPFPISKIKNHSVERVRAELKRMRVLDRETRRNTREQLSWYFDLTREERDTIADWGGEEIEMSGSEEEKELLVTPVKRKGLVSKFGSSALSSAPKKRACPTHQSSPLEKRQKKKESAEGIEGVVMRWRGVSAEREGSALGSGDDWAVVEAGVSLQGIIWDETWTCAYDSLLTPLWHHWQRASPAWRERLAQSSIHSWRIDHQFQALGADPTDEQVSKARMNVRKGLTAAARDAFPEDANPNGVGWSELIEAVFPSTVDSADGRCVIGWRCEGCGRFEPSERRNPRPAYLGAADLPENPPSVYTDQPWSMQKWMWMILKRRLASARHEHRDCGNCSRVMTAGEQEQVLDTPPACLVINTSSVAVQLSSKVALPRNSDSPAQYRLIGAAYVGGFHFTARVFLENVIYSYDGAQSGGRCLVEGVLDGSRAFSMQRRTLDLQKLGTRKLCAAIYALEG